MATHARKRASDLKTACNMINRPKNCPQTRMDIGSTCCTLSLIYKFNLVV